MELDTPRRRGRPRQHVKIYVPEEIVCRHGRTPAFVPGHGLARVGGNSQFDRGGAPVRWPMRDGCCPDKRLTTAVVDDDQSDASNRPGGRHGVVPRKCFRRRLRGLPGARSTKNCHRDSTVARVADADAMVRCQCDFSARGPGDCRKSDVKFRLLCHRPMEFPVVPVFVDLRRGRLEI